MFGEEKLYILFPVKLINNKLYIFEFCGWEKNGIEKEEKNENRE